MARPKKHPEDTVRVSSRGAAFTLYWRDAHGRRQRRSLGHVPRDHADAVAALKRAELRLGRPLEDTEAKDVLQETERHRSSFTAFAQDEYLPWRAQQFPDSHERVAQIVEQHLVPFFRFRPLAQCTKRVVDEYKGQRRRAGAKDGTLKKELDTLSAILRQAEEWGSIDQMPCHPAAGFKIQDQRSITYYDRDELDTLYQFSPYHGPIWILLANTGLRASEALRLRRRHVRNGMLAIEWSDGERTKSGRYRYVPLNEAAERALTWRRFGDDYILPRITRQSLGRAFKKCAQRAGLPGSMHTLRHTFCSHLVLAGIPLTTVKELAGHESIETTMKYAHLRPGHLQDAIRAIDL